MPPASPPDARPDPAGLRDLAAELASAAGTLLLAHLEHARSSVTTKTSGTDMVTEMDHRSEALIVEGLLAARPHDGVLGEEGTSRAGTSGITWVVDPLDGTTNYLYGYPGWGVSIAACVDGTPIAAAVADPMHGDLFTAAHGGGATRNGMPIAVRDETAGLATALIATGFSYEPARRARQAIVLEHLLPRVRDIRRGGAAAVDLCWVACGRVDAFYERGLQPWDLAAGWLIATEAGATVGDLTGGVPSPAFVLAAAPHLFAPLRDELRAVRAEAA